MGRLRLTQQAPTESAFSDWAVPARDESGVDLVGVREIPNDALRIRATETLPNGATSTWREGQPVGAASGLTLLQANVLRLQVDYVLRMRVPLAGQAIALMARNWQTDPALRAMGGRDGVLIRVSVAVRMQSGARHTGGDPGNG